jgi:hypothetical protein
MQLGHAMIVSDMNFSHKPKLTVAPPDSQPGMQNGFPSWWMKSMKRMWKVRSPFLP